MRVVLKRVKRIHRNFGLTECFDVKVSKNKNFLLLKPNIISHNSNYIGQQFLKTLGTFEGVKMPEQSLRALYEEKKYNAFEQLQQFSKVILDRPVVSPYTTKPIIEEQEDKLDVDML